MVSSDSAPESLRRLANSEAPRSFHQFVVAMDDLVKSKGWYEPGSSRPQTPRNLAISIVLESTELLENFQWSTQANIAAVVDELADVVLYSLQLAGVLGIDLERALLGKLLRNHSRTWEEATEDIVT
jgi:NTP pyrophosphatase (non-canonical NTP hydrolase)